MAIFDLELVLNASFSFSRKSIDSSRDAIKLELFERNISDHNKLELEEILE